MGALDDFLAGEKGVQPQDMNNPKNFNAKDPNTLKQLNKFYKAEPKTDQRLAILQQELADEQAKLKAGDVRAQANIDALNREMQFVGGKVPAKPAQSTSALDDFLSQSQEQGPPLKLKSSGGVKAEPIPQMPATQTPTQPTTGEKLVGLGELGLTAASSLFAPIVGGVAGIAENVFSGTLGTKEGLQKAEKTAGEVSQALTYEPRTEAGKAVTGRAMGTLQEAFEASKLPPVMPEALPLGSARKPIIEKAPVVKPIAIADRIEPTTGKPRLTAEQYKQKLTQEFYGKLEGQAMAGVGAAKTADASTLAEAIARATPELKTELSKVKPGDLNVEALNRIMAADQLPKPVRYTRGQATQDPKILSDEINILGSEKKYADRLNEQNATLNENVDLMKDRVAPNITTTDYVHDAENVIERVNNFIKTDKDAITNAYKALEEQGAGKIQVDSKTFADNAIKALSKDDDLEFLPSVFAKKIEDYANGKEMNFNQFENLRSQIAKEIRKAQKNDDGNTVHALALMRSELEQLPLLNETAEAKTLADKARSLAKSQFDLLDKTRDTYNPLYEKVFNGGADTKDLIQSLLLRGKNAHFDKVLELAKNDPTTMEHLRSGALDSIIRDSTTQDGKFKAAIFAKKIRDLDLNKRLEPLFGEEAKTLRDIADAGVTINARPAGSYVNESKSGVVGVQMAKQFIAEQAKAIPGYGMVVQPAAKVLGERKISKQVEKALKPGAGVKLSDIGKKK
jgi:hypothetical protein